MLFAGVLPPSDGQLVIGWWCHWPHPKVTTCCLPAVELEKSRSPAAEPELPQPTKLEPHSTRSYSSCGLVTALAPALELSCGQLQKESSLQLPHLTSSRAAAISITGSCTKSVNNAELESVSALEPILEAGLAPSPETDPAPAPDQVQLLGQLHSQSWWDLQHQPQQWLRH